MNANGQVELLDKGIFRLIDDKINEAGNDLDNLFNDLTLHGGYAASLLFGGVVLKKADRIVNSVRIVSPGDEVDCVFKDGEAKATIDEVKSEV
jgi:exodeoxyribonuclease VII large subunit